jgi:hypothetical protein
MIGWNDRGLRSLICLIRLIRYEGFLVLCSCRAYSRLKPGFAILVLVLASIKSYLLLVKGGSSNNRLSSALSGLSEIRTDDHDLIIKMTLIVNTVLASNL